MRLARRDAHPLWPFWFPRNAQVELWFALLEGDHGSLVNPDPLANRLQTYATLSCVLCDFDKGDMFAMITDDEIWSCDLCARLLG
jgi:hypothetical protein